MKSIACRGIRSSIAGIVAIAAISGSISCGPVSADAALSSTPAPALTSTSEQVFREDAISKAYPTCPNSLRLAQAAVGVAKVSVGMKGNVLAVEVLEAPGDSAKSALEAGFFQWRFRPLELIDGRPQVYSALLTVYFLPGDHGPCRVVYPDEIGYVGR